MVSENHFRKLENMYHQVKMSGTLQTVARIKEGQAEVTMPVRDSQKHAANALHGMYYFKLLDDAAFFAANSIVEKVFVLTSQFNVYLTKPVFTGTLKSVGQVVNQGKNQIIAESILYNDGHEVARGSGTFMKSSVELTTEIGYKLD